MAKDRLYPLSEVTFRCKVCQQNFSSSPARVEAAPEQDFHPYAYFADCPSCGAEAEQASWERNLLKAWANATGPKTPEGVAATAANLQGHPTPEEALRTRFNAMKHGLSARTATYFPSRPDGYAFCRACDVDRAYCASQPACVKKTELFMLHHAAFEQRNPKHLMGIYADLQASVLAVVQQIIQTIVADGVKVEQVVWDKDAEGNIRVAEYVDEKGERRILRENVIAHPLFRPLGEMLTRAGLSLSDMGMTAKMVEDEESALGRLEHDHTEQESLSEYRQRSLAALEAMAHKVMRAAQQTEKDPILIEYQQENGAT